MQGKPNGTKMAYITNCKVELNCNSDKKDQNTDSFPIHILAQSPPNMAKSLM